VVDHCHVVPAEEVKDEPVPPEVNSHSNATKTGFRLELQCWQENNMSLASLNPPYHGEPLVRGFTVLDSLGFEDFKY
jgi:hypothetical protein